MEWSKWSRLWRLLELWQDGCRPHPADLAVCDCWEYCPQCGKKMEPFTPDLSPQSYESGDLGVVMICKDMHRRIRVRRSLLRCA